MSDREKDIPQRPTLLGSGVDASLYFGGIATAFAVAAFCLTTPVTASAVIAALGVITCITAGGFAFGVAMGVLDRVEDGIGRAVRWCLSPRKPHL
ncbi:MAG TPA: hypothetical protein VGG48_01125 [Rhizomicrobium sp.]|jgi:hypothetical protein